MADDTHKGMEGPVTKRLKTSHSKGEDQGDSGSSLFRDMLFEVGENLTSKHVEELANLADLSVGEKDGIWQHTGNKSIFLFQLLEGKEKINKNDVLWLYSNLTKIGNKTAAKIVNSYITGKDESMIFPNEPDPSSSDDDDECSSFQDFLSELRLQNRFPGKTSLKMFLTVKDVPDKQDYMESFWQKLTSLDYRAGLPGHSLSNRFSMRDFIFSVLHCSDDFVRQDILEKMSACQLAVPVVLKGIDGVPTTFLLWALRRITKKWKGPQDCLSKEQPIASYPVFIVSVLRVGDVSVSKSQVLNTMLSYSQGNTLHSYFLTGEIDIVKPKFSQGTIECAWFLPMYGNDKEIFKEVIAFFNLRGDCKNHSVQRKFACKSSNLTIVFIETDKRNEHVELIKEIKEHSRKFLFVSLKEGDKSKLKSQKVHHPRYIDHWLFVRILQMDVLSKKICDLIVHTCSTEDKSQYKCLMDLRRLVGESMHVDEHINVCKDAQLLVSNLFKSACFDDILNFKKICFPLQGIWKELVLIEKKVFDSDNETHETFQHKRESILSEKRTKRELQLQTCLSKTMKIYYDIITASKDNPSLLHYILGFLQDRIYHVVNQSTKADLHKILQLERVLRERQSIVSGGSGLVNSGATAGTDMELRTELTCQDMLTECSKLHKQCREKNLGCEHFLRELGQIYEAFQELKHPQTHMNLDSAEIILLPELAASLVNEMHSLEILDGDTGSVPLTWVTSVLDALTRKLGDPKVLVLSVIGVQSSGKSTFLNSMFGVRFPVRAGRCTRGLFIRFLQMEEKLAKELGCEYLIVVDTEGIRSLDHDDRRFDNELVTLALSIANVTIFNIEGENIGPDMTGILQIAAHALMRMKEVDLECHCRIVQQRVSDLTAGDRNKANTNRIMETLDHATKIAAEEEGLEGRYQFFADVVHLQADENLQYIPCLWAGGMSPPNHMYSETVGKMKSQLFTDIRQKTILSNFTLSTFTQRIIDVWKAVQEEDFVFNFQDSVRAVDFNKFCMEYNKWIAEMRSTMMVHTNNLLDRMQIDLGNEGSRVVGIEELKQSACSEVENQRKALIQTVETYISNHERSKVMQRYKRGFLDEINIILRDVENHAMAVLTDEYELRKLRLTKNLTKFKARWRRRLSFEAKKAAASIETDEPARDWRFLFEDNWKKWAAMINNECAENKTKVTFSSLQTVCEKLLLRITRDMAVGSEIRTLMSLEGGIDKHNGIPEDCAMYVHTKFVKAWMKHKLLAMHNNDDNLNIHTEEDLIDIERQTAVRYVENIIESEFVQMVEKQIEKPFDGNLYQFMLQSTLDKLSEKHGNFKPPQMLVAKSLLCISGKSLRFLYDNESRYGNNFSAFLGGEEHVIIDDFRTFLTGCDYALTAAKFIYYYMKQLADLKLEKELTDKQYEVTFSTDFMRRNHWDVLHFAAKTFCDSFYTLFENLLFEPFHSLYGHLLQQRIFERLERIRKQIVDRVNLLVIDFTQIIESCERETRTGTFEEWGRRLANSLECDFIGSAGELFEVNSITDVSTELKRMITTDCLHTLTKRVFSWNPSIRIINVHHKMCGNACPMCHAPCDNPLRQHSNHFSHLHRPRGFHGATYTDSNKLVLEDCSSSVLSKSSEFSYEGRTYLCHKYKDIFPDWDIRPSSDDPGKIFWQWLFVLFNNYMASLYGCNPADIPQSWYSITKEDALDSLEEDKRLKMDGRFRMSSGSDL